MKRPLVPFALLLSILILTAPGARCEEDFPSTMDNAPVGSNASADNPFFTNFMNPPVTDSKWKKTGATTYVGPTGREYAFDPGLGTFDAVNRQVRLTGDLTQKLTGQAIFSQLDYNSLGLKIGEEITKTLDAEGRLTELRNASGELLVKFTYDASGNLSTLSDYVNRARAIYATSDTFSFDEAGYTRTITGQKGKVLAVFALNAAGEVAKSVTDVKHTYADNYQSDNPDAPNYVKYPVMRDLLNGSYKGRTAMNGYVIAQDQAYSNDYQKVLDAIGKESRSVYTARGEGQSLEGQVHTYEYDPDGAGGRFVSFDGSKQSYRNIPLISMNYKNDGTADKNYWTWSSSTHNQSGGGGWGVRYAYRQETVGAGGQVTSNTFFNDPTPAGSCPLVYGKVTKDAQGRIFLLGTGQTEIQVFRNGVAETKKVDVEGKPFLLSSVKRGEAAKEGGYYVYGGASANLNDKDWSGLVGQTIGLTGDLAVGSGLVGAGMQQHNTSGADWERRFGSGEFYGGQEAAIFYVNDSTVY